MCSAQGRVRAPGCMWVCTCGPVCVWTRDCLCVFVILESQPLSVLADRDILCTHAPARGSMKPLSPSAEFYSKRLSVLGGGEPREKRPGRQSAQLSPDNLPFPAM